MTKRSLIPLATLLLCALDPAPAAELVRDSVPREGDRVTYRVPISAHFFEQVELDADGDGTYTRVDSASIESASSDIAVEVNDPGALVGVILEREDTGAPVAASASWSLRDFPPMLRVTPDGPLDRDTLYRLVFFEGTAAARRVSDGAPVDPYALTFRTLPAGATGEVRKETISPPSLDFDEVYNVYLPPGWGESPTQLYPALYLLHGGFGNEDTWRDTAESVINRLVDEGAIEPLVAVMPDGNRGTCVFPFIGEHRLFSNTYDGSLLYGDYTAYDLPAEIEARFQVESARWRRAVAGLSMGGFGAASVGLGHPDEFVFVAPLAGWQHSVRMVSPPGFPECLSSHWEVIPDFGNGCPGGRALQLVTGPVGSDDLTHMKTTNGRDLALATPDSVFRGQIFIAHGDADTTATVAWSDDISCALESLGTAHCYKRPEGVGHDGSLWDVAFEVDVLPRFNAIAYWADVPEGLDDACVNSTLRSPADADQDGVADALPDNCRDTPNADQADLDADGAGNACDADDDGDLIVDALDCDPLDASLGTPPAAGPLTLSGSATTLVEWPALPSADTYDVARGSLAALTGGSEGECVAEDLVAPLFEDPVLPSPGDGFFYLVRGRDAGCGGPGPWGGDRQPSGCSM